MTKQKMIDEQRKEIKALKRELNCREERIRSLDLDIDIKGREIERRKLRLRHEIREKSDMLSGCLSVTAWIPCYDADMGHDVLATFDIYDLLGIDHLEVLKEAFNVKTALEDFYRLMHEDVLVSISLNDWPEEDAQRIQRGLSNG